MRLTTLLSAALCAAPAVAQNWYIPDNIPTAGTCNVIPFGSGVGSGFAQCKYHTRVLATDLGSVPNILTGLGFAACSSGRAHYDSLEIVIDHIPTTQPLSTTFANNLTPAAVTVLNVTNYTWNLTANTWNEIGLQNLFAYNGTDDIVVQITTVNGLAPAGFHRATRERIYWVATAGSPPPTGTAGNAAGKIEVSMLMARTSSHGDGCTGSNGTPTIGITGSPMPNTAISLDLTNGVPNGIALLVAGTSNASPFPLDLGFLGAPNCYAYTDLAFTGAVVLDPSGAGGYTLGIPGNLIGFRFFAQYAVLDPAANSFGFTTSNYLNLLTGN